MNTDAPPFASIRSAKYEADRLDQWIASLIGAKLYQWWCFPVGCRTGSPSVAAPMLSSEEPVRILGIKASGDVDTAGRLPEVGHTVVKADPVTKKPAASQMMTGIRRLRASIFEVFRKAEQAGSVRGVYCRTVSRSAAVQQVNRIIQIPFFMSLSETTEGNNSISSTNRRHKKELLVDCNMPPEYPTEGDRTERRKTEGDRTERRN